MLKEEMDKGSLNFLNELGVAHLEHNDVVDKAVRQKIKNDFEH